MILPMHKLKGPYRPRNPLGEIRYEAGLTQGEAAAAIGALLGRGPITKQYLQAVESGRTVCSESTLRAMHKAYRGRISGLAFARMTAAALKSWGSWSPPDWATKNTA